MDNIIEALEGLKVPLESVKLDPRNARHHPARNVKAIMDSLNAYGQRKPIVVNAGTKIIEAGNGMWEAAQALGWDQIAVAFVKDDKAVASAYSIMDNQSALLAEWDLPTLKDLLGELDDGATNMDLTGFTGEDIELLMTQLHVPGQGLTDKNKLPDDVDAVCELGDLWQLGDHKLLCGDATRKEDVERLLGIDRPKLMATDPPYGIWLDHTWRDKVGINRLGKGNPATIKGDDPTFDWTAAFALSRCPIIYVWHGALHGDAVQGQLKDAGYEVRQQIIWNKDQALLGRAAYHWKHETCWYAVLKGEKSYWVGDRTQTTVWECASPKHIFGNSEDGKYDHPTQKPVLLTEIPLINHTHVGEICYDPFGGSGSSLIACEELGRKCCMMDILPHYCDVTIRRWQDYTGKEAVKL